MRAFRRADRSRRVYPDSGSGGSLYSSVFLYNPRGNVSRLKASVLVYLALGLAGLPIFAQGGGPGYVLVPSFGYLIGFAAGTFLTGKLTEGMGEPSLLKLLGAGLAGLAAVYAVGLLYCYLICRLALGTPVAFWPLFLYGFLLAVPGDLALCLLCASVGKRMIPVLRRGNLAPAGGGERRSAK